jgi:predicted SPOUT superfamily RNA methylase MTH1
MPDIATALRQALDDWEPPTAAPAASPTAPYFTVTNNVTRVTFNFVRDNPGKTRVEVAKALEQQGYKAGSVSSLLGQMLKQGMMRESAHLLYVTMNEYAPLKSARALKAQAAKPQAQQRKIVTITRRAAPVAEPTPEVTEWSVESVIGHLNIRQASAVYNELRKLFGG